MLICQILEVQTCVNNIPLYQIVHVSEINQNKSQAHRIWGAVGEFHEHSSTTSSQMPSLAMMPLRKFGAGGLVNRSASFSSSLRTYTTSSSLSETSSRINCTRTSMWFARPDGQHSAVAHLIADWLSDHIGTGLLTSIAASFRTRATQIDSCAARVSAYYFDAHVDKPTVVCFSEPQVPVASASLTMNRNIGLRSTVSKALSASTYATNSILRYWYCIPKLKVPRRYLSIPVDTSIAVGGW